MEKEIQATFSQSINQSTTKSHGILLKNHLPCSYLPIVEINTNDMVLHLTKNVGKEKWSAIDRYEKTEKTEKTASERTFVLAVIRYRPDFRLPPV